MKELYLKLFDQLYDQYLEQGMSQKEAYDLAGTQAYEQLPDLLGDVADYRDHMAEVELDRLRNYSNFTN
jgi:hypothetical protein